MSDSLKKPKSEFLSLLLTSSLEGIALYIQSHFKFSFIIIVYIMIFYPNLCTLLYKPNKPMR